MCCGPHASRFSTNSLRVGLLCGHGRSHRSNRLCFLITSMCSSVCAIFSCCCVLQASLFRTLRESFSLPSLVTDCFCASVCSLRCWLSSGICSRQLRCLDLH